MNVKNKTFTIKKLRCSSMIMLAKVKRGRLWNSTPQKMKLYETIVKGWKPLATASKISILEFAEFLDPSLIIN